MVARILQKRKGLAALRIVLSHLIFASFMFSHAVASQVVAIKGKVISESNDPILTARVRAYDGSRLLTLSPEPVDLKGEFQIQLTSFSGSHLTCEVVAPTFETRRITLVISDGKAEAGSIVMVRKPTLKVDSLAHNRSSDNLHQFLDMLVVNESTTTITVKSLQLSGALRRDTTCLDPSPGLIFEVKDLTEGQRTKSSASASVIIPESSFRDDIAIEGSLTFLPCKQIRMSFSISWPFSISPNERQKIRVTLPREVSHKTLHQKRILELERWQVVFLRLKLDDGNEITTQINEQ